MKVMTWNVQWCCGSTSASTRRASSPRRAPGRFRRAVPAGDRRELPASAPARQRRRGPVRGARLAAPRLHGGARRGHRPSGGRRQPPPLRQPDPVAIAGAAGLPAPAAVAGGSGHQRHAAHRGRGGGERAVRRRAHHHHASRVVLAPQRSAQVEALRAIYAEGHGHARAGSIVDEAAGRSTRICGRRRRSSAATSTSNTTIRCMRGWGSRSPTARRRSPTPGTSCIPARPIRRRSAREMGAGRSGAALRFPVRQPGAASAGALGARRPGHTGVGPPAGDARARVTPFALPVAALGLKWMHRSPDHPFAHGIRSRRTPLSPILSPSASSALTFTGERFAPERRRDLARALAPLLCRGAARARAARARCGVRRGLRHPFCCAPRPARSSASISRRRRWRTRARATARRTCATSAASVTALPLADRGVDLVVSFETIEHLAEQAEMLAEFRRVLAPAACSSSRRPTSPSIPATAPFENEFHVAS